MLTSALESDAARGVHRARGLDPATWVVGFFVANFLLQRVSVLPTGNLSAAMPLAVGWVALALARRVVVLEPRRFLLWLTTAGLSGLLLLAQLALVAGPIISLSSWMFWMVAWLPFVVRVRDASVVTYRRCAQGIARAGVWMGALSVVFLLLQLVGLPYRDYFGQFVPKSLQVQGFVISYPISYGSPIYRSNAWFALEPSFLSFTLAVSAMCAIYAGMRWWGLLTILAGILATFAGSGIAVLAVSLIVLAISRERALLRPYLPALGVVAVVAFLTPLQQLVFSRAGEFTSTGSSSSLRGVEPYLNLWPTWISDTWGLLLGNGAGSSRVILDGMGVPGLVVPNVARALFDYGVIVGFVLLCLIVLAHLRSPAPALAAGILVSLLLLQPGAQGILNCLFAAVTWWAPTAWQARVSHGGSGPAGDASGPPMQSALDPVIANGRHG